MSALDQALREPPHLPDVGKTSALSGLARRRVSRIDIYAQSISAIGPSSGALIATVAAAQIAGSAVWLSVLVAIVVMWVLSQVFGQFASRVSGSGSLYTFVARSIGPRLALTVLISLMAGYAALVGFGLTQAANHVVRAAAVDADTPSAIARVTVLLLLVVALIAVLITGVRVSTRITLIAELAGMVLLVVLVAASLATNPLAPARFSLDGVSVGQVLLGAGVMAGALLGFESSAALGSEAYRPLASVPRAMSTSVLFSGSLYLLAVLAGGPERPDNLPGASSAVGFLGGETTTALYVVAHAALALCFLPIALAAWTSLSRLVFLAGREGTLPRWIGGLAAGSRVPRRAILATLPFVTLPALVFILHGDIDGQGFTMIAGPLLLSAYAITCFALPSFLRRIDESSTRWTAISVGSGVAISIILLAVLSEHIAQSEYLAVLSIVATAALACIWWQRIQRRRDPGADTHTPLGAFDHTLSSDLWGEGRM